MRTKTQRIIGSTEFDLRSQSRHSTNDLAIPFAEPEHSTIGEPRFALLGMCESGLVFISFTIRDEKYRIITARKASKRMHKIYAEND